MTNHDQDTARSADARDDDRRSVGAIQDVLRCRRPLFDRQPRHGDELRRARPRRFRNKKIFAVSKTRIAERNVGNGLVVCCYLTTGAFRPDCNRSLR